MERKTILLTGATGYLGSELLRFWLKEGHKLIALKRSHSSTKRIYDIVEEVRFYDVDNPNWEACFSDNQVDLVVHTAAAYGRKGESQQEIIKANYLFPTRLLELSINCGVKSFVNTASSLPKGVNDYSLTKYHFQDWMFQKKSDIHVINMVLEYFYGPGDDDWKFISMVVNRLKNNDSKIDFTNGLQKRDFIYISDVITAFNRVLVGLESLESGTHVPVGSGQTHTLRFIAELCKSILGNKITDLRFGAIPDRNNEIMKSKADITLLKELGWYLEHDLQSGLKNMIK